MNNTLNQLAKPEPAILHHEASAAFFKDCPFDGSKVNVFQVPEDRYGENAPYGWVVECMNMGCIYNRPEKGDQSLAHLSEWWNKRA